ncbi:MAG: hypothetical protein ACE5IO_01625 [Thermoplasmata archaeon]
MPISKKEFKKGRPVTSTEKTVMNFLKKNPQEAYTAREIVEAIGYLLGQDVVSDVVTTWAIVGTLETLIGEKTVVKRQIGFVDYYMIKG